MLASSTTKMHNNRLVAHLEVDGPRKCWQSPRGRLDPYKTQCWGKSPGKVMKFPHNCHLTCTAGHQRKVNGRESQHTLSA